MKVLLLLSLASKCFCLKLWEAESHAEQILRDEGIINPGQKAFVKEEIGFHHGIGKYMCNPGKFMFAGAFSGGGCISVLSQLGMLKSLYISSNVRLPDEIMPMQMMGCNSGGCWAFAVNSALQSRKILGDHRLYMKFEDNWYRSQWATGQLYAEDMGDYYWKKFGSGSSSYAKYTKYMSIDLAFPDYCLFKTNSEGIKSSDTTSKDADSCAMGAYCYERLWASGCYSREDWTPEVLDMGCLLKWRGAPVGNYGKMFYMTYDRMQHWLQPNILGTTEAPLFCLRSSFGCDKNAFEKVVEWKSALTAMMGVNQVCITDSPMTPEPTTYAGIKDIKTKRKKSVHNVLDQFMMTMGVASKAVAKGKTIQEVLELYREAASYLTYASYLHESLQIQVYQMFLGFALPQEVAEFPFDKYIAMWTAGLDAVFLEYEDWVHYESGEEEYKYFSDDTKPCPISIHMTITSVSKIALGMDFLGLAYKISPETPSDFSFLDAITYAGSAAAMVLQMIQIQLHMMSNCFLFAMILQEQVNTGKYAYPWSSLDSSFLKSLWKRQRSDKILWKHDYYDHLDSKNSSSSIFSSAGAATALAVSASSVKEKEVMMQQSTSTQNSQKVHMSWKENLDGAMADNGGMGELLKEMGSSPLKPGTIIAFYSGMFTQGTTILSVKHMFHYFNDYVSFRDTFISLDSFTAKMLMPFYNPYFKSCPLPIITATNQNYFFAKINEGPCDTWSLTPGMTCHNPMYYAVWSSMMYFEGVSVVSNSWWGILGGFEINVVFNLVTPSVMSVSWVKGVFARNEYLLSTFNLHAMDETESTIEACLMSGSCTHVFPTHQTAKESAALAPPLGDGWALFSFSAYKGFFMECALAWATRRFLPLLEMVDPPTVTTHGKRYQMYPWKKVPDVTGYDYYGKSYIKSVDTQVTLPRKCMICYMNYEACSDFFSVYGGDVPFDPSVAPDQIQKVNHQCSQASKRVKRGKGNSDYAAGWTVFSNK